MAILRRAHTRNFSSSSFKTGQTKLPLQPPRSDSSSTIDDPSKRSAHLSIGGIANMFIKLRHLERRSKAPNSISCTSGLEPLTHPHSHHNADTEPRVFSKHADTYVCSGSGGVDTALLLRATRAVLVQEASRRGATLAHEQ